MDTTPLLIILTGKTASGKDTIKLTLLKNYPNLKKVITTTSRIPRVNEQDGLDYHFLTRTKFEDKIKNNIFAEFVEYGGNLYGTQKTEFEQALANDTLWKIDPSRAGEVREFIKRSFPTDLAEKLIKRILVIYINASDEAILERLQRRNLSKDEIEKRMSDDKKIWDQYKNSYDFIIENQSNRLDETLLKIEQIINDHKS